MLLVEQSGNVSVSAENADYNDLVVPYLIKDLIVSYGEASNPVRYLRPLPAHLRCLGERPALFPEQIDKTVGGVLIVLCDIIPDVVQIQQGLARKFEFHSRIIECGLSVADGLFS